MEKRSVPDYERIAEGVRVPEEFLGPMSGELAGEEEIPWVSARQTQKRERGRPKGSLNDKPEKRENFAEGYFPEDHPKYQGIATSRGFLQHKGKLQHVRYSHEALIDVIIAEPMLKRSEIAQRFGRTTAWVTCVTTSDAFQAALAKRREEIVDPFLVATVRERFEGLALQSLDVIGEKLEATKNADLAIKSLDISAKALGFGARGPGGGGTVHNNFVVQLPPKAGNAQDWANDHAGGKLIEG